MEVVSWEWNLGADPVHFMVGNGCVSERLAGVVMGLWKTIFLVLSILPKAKRNS